MKPRFSLLTVLLAINAAVIVLVLAITAFAVNTYASQSFMQIMKTYDLTTEPLQRAFLTSVNRTMVGAGLLALLLGAGLSWWLTRRVVQPLRRIQDKAQAVARGHYDVRIGEAGAGEVRRLTRAFNRMAESLAATERLRRDLVTNVGHELRTPLANIQGYLEALEEGVMPPTDEVFALLGSETERLNTLVEAIGELTRVEAALQDDLDCETIDLQQLLRERLELFRPQLAEKELTLDKSGWDSGQAVIEGDRTLLQRALTNVIDNACRYSPAGSTVTVGLAGPTDDPSGEGSQCRLRFGNPLNQPIEPEDADYLFERFYRVEKSRSRQYGGAGIGLALTAEIVRAHGGRLRADVDRDWIEFILTLPCRRADR